MKPHTKQRKGKGYCCEWCDGPYNKWKLTKKKQQRHRDRQDSKVSFEQVWKMFKEGSWD